MFDVDTLMFYSVCQTQFCHLHLKQNHSLSMVYSNTVSSKYTNQTSHSMQPLCINKVNHSTIQPERIPGVISMYTRNPQFLCPSDRVFICVNLMHFRLLLAHENLNVKLRVLKWHDVY